METSQKSSSRKVRWSVPRADRSVNEWLDNQWDISVSLRLLIRESIQREGYIDVMNRDVDQLPRRGRPPGPNLGQDPGQDQTVSDQDASESHDIRGRKPEGSSAIEVSSETSAQDSRSSKQSSSSTKDKPDAKTSKSEKKTGRATDEIMGMLGME